MRQRFSIAALLMVCMLLLAASFAPGAEDVLKLVPDSASGLVLINQPATFNAKLQELSREMQIPVPDLLALFKQQFNIHAGWDENETIALVLIQQKDIEAIPALILLIPVTNYDKFIEQFKPEKLTGQVTKIECMNFPICARNIGGYAALTDLSHQEVLENTLKISKDIPDALEPWREWLGANNVAGVFMQPGIEHLSDVLQIIKPLLARFRKIDITEADLDLYRKAMQVVDKEVTSCGLGIQFDKQDLLRITSRTLLVPGGKLTKCIEEKKLASNELLKGLPDEPFMFIAAGSVSVAWDLGGMSFLQNIKSKPESSELLGLKREQLDKMPNMLPENMGARTAAMVWKAGPNEGSFLSSIVIVTQVDDSNEFLIEYEKYVRRCDESISERLNPMSPSIDINKIFIDIYPALHITVNLPMLPKGGQIFDIFKKFIFGPEDKIDTWLVAINEHTIITGHGNQDLLRKTIKDIQNGKPGLTDNVEISKASLLLPPDPIFIAFLNFQGMADFIKQVALKIIPLEEKDNFPECPKTPLVSFAVAKASNELKMCLVVPVEVVKAVSQFFQNNAKFRSLRKNASKAK